MPASEIDDIFAAKGKKVALPVASTSSQPPAEKPKKKNNKKRVNQTQQQVSSEQDTAEVEDPSGAKRRVPETVLDPSVRLAPVKPRGSQTVQSTPSETKAKKRKLENDDEERFRDSRGTGPRRKTEDGFAIYKEDELGITDAGGDTPLYTFHAKKSIGVHPFVTVSKLDTSDLQVGSFEASSASSMAVRGQCVA